jgi:hypothetical protein
MVQCSVTPGCHYSSDNGMSLKEEGTMPYSVPDGAIVQVTFSGKVLNQQMLSVLHYQYENPGGSEDGAALLDGLAEELNIADGLHDKYTACLSTDYTFGRIRTQWIIPTRYAYFEKLPTITQGQDAGRVIGPNAAIAINKRTEIAGVHGRGVLHMPGVSTTWITGGQLNVAGFAVYNTLGAKLIEDLTVLAGTFHPIIFNRATPGEVAFLNNWVTSPDVRTMHRRTVGLGS